MIETARVTLRPWRDDDIEPFAAICGDQRSWRIPAGRSHTSKSRR